MAAATEPSKVTLCNLPTPVTRLKQFIQTAELNKYEISITVKRDDTTDCLMHGSKARKLEYILERAMQLHATAIITCGAAHSNHARVCAIAAKRLGMKCFLLLETEDGKRPPQPLTGNLFLANMAGAEICFCAASEGGKKQETMEQMARAVKSTGESPFIISEEGTDVLSLWGYIGMMKELASLPDIREFTHIVCAVGSGGTLGGILIGKQMYNLPNLQVIGVPVSHTAEYFKSTISGLVEQFNIRHHQGGDGVQIGEYELWDGYMGRELGVPYRDEIQLAKQLAATEGIFLDPSYTGKAFFALMDQIKKGTVLRGSRVLFLHSGGIFELLAQSNLYGEPQPYLIDED